MSFSDEDLKQLRDFLETKIVKPELDPSGEETIAFKYKMNALLARLDAAEDAIAKRKKHDEFDCPHVPEDRCICGSIHVQLWAEYEVAEALWLKSAGKPQGEGGR